MTGSLYIEDLEAALKKTSFESTKMAAMGSLGFLGCSESVDLIHSYVGSQALTLSAAACQALGNIGRVSDSIVSDIAGKLMVPEVRFAAVSALVELGEGACSMCIGELIKYGLQDQDGLTRQYAGSAVALCGDTVLDSKEHLSDLKALLQHQDAG